MRPSTILRNLHISLLRLGSHAVVVPLPIPTLIFTPRISKDIEAFHSANACFNTTKWLLHALDASIVSQRIARESLSNLEIRHESWDLEAIDQYFEYNIALLDACNDMSNHMDLLHKYVESLIIATHKLEGRFGSTDLARNSHVKKAMERCQSTKRQCREIRKCNSSLQKLNGKLAQLMSSQFSCTKNVKLGEVLIGSLHFASFVCEVLTMGLSFKSKHRFSMWQTKFPMLPSWSSSFHELQKKIKEETEKKHKRRGGGILLLPELERTINASQLLRKQMMKSKKNNQGEVWKTVEQLKRRCEELDEVFIPFEEKVMKELYKELISFRMDLLGIVSSL